MVAQPLGSQNNQPDSSQVYLKVFFYSIIYRCNCVELCLFYKVAKFMNTTINKLQKIISNLLVLVVLFLISPVQVYAAAKATGGTYTEVGGYGIHK